MKRFESRFQNPKCVFGSEKVNFGLPIRIPDEAIQISDVAIRIQIPESFPNSEKVKNGLAIRIPKGAIRIPYVKAADKSWICTQKKKCIFLHDPNVFWILLFLTKMKIRSKSF